MSYLKGKTEGTKPELDAVPYLSDILPLLQQLKTAQFAVGGKASCHKAFVKTGKRILS